MQRASWAERRERAIATARAALPIFDFAAQMRRGVQAIRPPSAHGPFVYAMRSASGFIKVGSTSQALEQRMATIATVSPEPLQLVAFAKGDAFHERQVHAELAPWLWRGEWFLPSEPVLAFVANFEAEVASVAAKVGYTSDNHNRAVTSAWKRAAKQHPFGPLVLPPRVVGSGRPAVRDDFADVREAVDGVWRRVFAKWRGEEVSP